MTRRRAFQSLLAMAAATTGLGFKVAAANELGRYVMQTDVSQPPTRRPKILNAMELLIGPPEKYLPNSTILKTVMTEHPQGAARTMPVGYAASGAPSFDRVSMWQSMLHQASQTQGIDQLAMVNEFMNMIPYIPDQRQFGTRDHWQTPEEFLQYGGDCEDFAIAKYTSLTMLGYHPERLRMVIADDLEKGVAHAFLAVYLAGDVHVLDNQIQSVVPQEKLRHYHPICSLTDQRLWVHWKTGKKADPKLAVERFQTIG